MFITRRFLQTSISLQKPLRSKLDRFERIRNEIDTVYRTIKAERSNNLSLIHDTALKNGKIPSIKAILSKIDEECKDWDGMKETIAVLKEMRFLGFPKRTEISSALLNRLAKIYAADPESSAENLLTCLENLTVIDEMNPLIIPSESSFSAEDNDALSEAYKTIIYTLQDMMMSKQ